MSTRIFSELDAPFESRLHIPERSSVATRRTCPYVRLRKWSRLHAPPSTRKKVKNMKLYITLQIAAADQ